MSDAYFNAMDDACLFILKHGELALQGPLTLCAGATGPVWYDFVMSDVISEAAWVFI